MIGINFIPAARLRVRKVRRRAAWWSVGSGVWAIGLVGFAILVAGAVPMHRSDEVARRTDAARAAQERTEKDIAKESRQVATLQRALDISTLVQDHPDWSLLLSRVGELRGPAVVLQWLEVDRVSVRPEFEPRPAPAAPGAPAPAPSPTAAKPKPERPIGELFVVKVAGLAQSAGEAQKFVLRLDQSGMFDSVTLLETGSAQTTGFTAMFFRVQCKVSDRPKPPAPGKPTATAAKPAAKATPANADRSTAPKPKEPGQ